MQDLEITWPDGSARFSPEHSPVQLGRSSEAEIPLTEGSVSRRHLELAWGGSVWTASDSSTHGTFDTAGRRLAPRWTIASDTVVRLGGIKGVEIQIAVAGSDDLASDDLASDDVAPDDAASTSGNNSEAAGVSRGLFSDNLGTLVSPRPTDHDYRSPVASMFSDQATGSDRGAPAEAPANESGLGQPTPYQPAPAEPALYEPVEVAPPSAFDFDRGTENSNGQSQDQPDLGHDLNYELGQNPDLNHDQRLDREDLASGFQGSKLLESDPRDSAGSGISFDSARPDTPAPSVGLDGPDLAIPGATGGHPAVRLSPNTTIISDATLRVNVDGQDFSFVPGADITVGRDPSCLVVVDERHSLVSRKHLRINHRDGAWWLEDFSSKGTFVDNKRIKGPYKVEGAFVANLGDDDAGTTMRIITAGEHRVPRGFNPLVIAGLAAAALIPLVILAVLLTRTDGSSIEPDFSSAKRSTVMLFGLDGGQGTGFFIDENLILTNQHVAVLSPQMLVAVSRQTDEPAQIEYATELVANHPFLDIAVLRVSNKATMTRTGPEISSDPVGDINLPSVAVGDSNDITIGDEVFSTGFPDRLSITSTDDMGDLRLPPVAATSGEAASFTIWPGCSNPNFEAFIPVDSPPGVACSAGGDVDKGVLRATFSSGQGASGSAVFHNNKVVAVVYAGDAEDSNKSLNVSTAAFSTWLDEIIDANP